jgi:hypothetical protein
VSTWTAEKGVLAVARDDGRVACHSEASRTRNPTRLRVVLSGAKDLLLRVTGSLATLGMAAAGATASVDGGQGQAETEEGSDSFDRLQDFRVLDEGHAGSVAAREGDELSGDLLRDLARPIELR